MQEFLADTQTVLFTFLNLCLCVCATIAFVFSFYLFVCFTFKSPFLNGSFLVLFILVLFFYNFISFHFIQPFSLSNGYKMIKTMRIGQIFSSLKRARLGTHALFTNVCYTLYRPIPNLVSLNHCVCVYVCKRWSALQTDKNGIFCRN